MTLSVYLNELFSYSILLPAAVICYFPMKNRLKYGRARICLQIMLTLAVLIPAASYLNYRFHPDENALMLPICAILFAGYHSTLTVHISKSLFIFSFGCAIMSFAANFSTGFDAILYPANDTYNISFEAIFFQLILSCAAAALLYYPLSRFGSLLIDNFNINIVWYISALVTLIFLDFNIIIIPEKYETLYFNHIFRFFWTALALMLTLFLLLCVLFYYIVNGMMETAKTEQRNRILEMQERQYMSQQKYIEATSKARHDFRHTIQTLYGLSKAQDYKAIDDYLEHYVQSLPENEVIHYCGNSALNALLNHYAQAAAQHSTYLDLRIELPEDMPVTDVDLCSMVGNILENAIAATDELPAEKRWIQFAVIVQHGAQLCIVGTNSFSGKVRVLDGRYVSTHKNGNGIGLASITSTVEKYGGTVVFSHENNEFYTDIMIPLI